MKFDDFFFIGCKSKLYQFQRLDIYNFSKTFGMIYTTPNASFLGNFICIKIKIFQDTILYIANKNPKLADLPKPVFYFGKVKAGLARKKNQPEKPSEKKKHMKKPHSSKLHSGFILKDFAFFSRFESTEHKLIVTLILNYLFLLFFYFLNPF